MNEKEFAKIYTLIESLQINMNKKEDDLKNQINEKDQLINELNGKLLNQEKKIKENENEIKMLNIKIERLTKENNIELKDNKDKINKINNLLSNQEKKLDVIYKNNLFIEKKIQKGNSNEDIQTLFQSDEFNNTLDINEFKNKFKNYNNFKELLNLKEIHLDILMGPCKLTKRQLDGRGNKCEGWNSGEYRGGKPYNPPIGWIGIGLRVWDRYDGENNWIGHNNNPEEWCVAYHGVACEESSDNVKKIIGLIYKNGFKAGRRQAHSYCNDINHPGNKVGIGIACSPSIRCAEMYAGISTINGIKYKTVIMVRVKPSAIRCCNCFNINNVNDCDNWIVNSDEIRPYRIIYKKCD